MADTSNLTNYLKDIAKAIKAKKGTTDPILAANFDIEIETIETSLASAGVKLFGTVDEMEADTTGKNGDLAVVRSSSITYIGGGVAYDNLYFPETITLPSVPVLGAVTEEGFGTLNITFVADKKSVIINLVDPDGVFSVPIKYIATDNTIRDKTYIREDLYDGNPVSDDMLLQLNASWESDVLTFKSAKNTLFTLNSLGHPSMYITYTCKTIKYIFEGLFEYDTFDMKWNYASSQLTANAEDVLTGKIAYGPNGIVVGTAEAGGGLDTSDATAVAQDLIKDKTAYVNGEKITGTRMEVTDYETDEATYIEDKNYMGFNINDDIAINSGSMVFRSG